MLSSSRSGESIRRKVDRERTLPGFRIVFFLIFLLVIACGGGEDAETGSEGEDQADSTAHSSSTEKNEKAIKVNVAPVHQGDLVIPIFADGVIQTPQSVSVKTKVSGEVIKVYVDDGDRVSRGQMIAQVDEREYILALEESRYRYYGALSQAAAEKETLTVNADALASYQDRKEELERQLRSGAMNRDEYQDQLLALEIEALQNGAFRRQLFEQRTGLGDARLTESRAKLDLEYTRIRAPFSGIIENLSVVQGEILSVGAPVCSIVNNDRLEAVVNVLEADLGNLVEGRPVLIAVPATGDTIAGRVDVISPQLDQTSRTCQVIIRFKNPEGRYRPGMFVRAEIAGFIHPDKRLVPKEAVLTRDNRPLVFKVNDGRAQWLYVQTGLENNQWVEIVDVFSGGSLSPGDLVVVSDHLTLAHEANISIRRTEPTEDRWVTLNKTLE